MILNYRAKKVEQCRFTQSLVAILTMLSGLCMSCKDFGTKIAQTTRSEDGSEHIVDAKMTPKIQYYAADPEFINKNNKLYFKIWNEAFSNKLDQLPLTGVASPERKPYSGGYYPEREGGTNVVMVGGKTPLQKYDDAFYGGQNRAVAWEIEKHTTGPVWAGHCNGFAAAAIRHPREPFRNVQRGGVTFSPQDIKALLAEIYMNADYEFIGGNRCNQAGDPSADRVLNPERSADPSVMDVCEDVNPGTLHLALTNWIGRMKFPLITDTSLGEEVWNYPAFSYQVLKREEIPESLARQYVSNSGGDYVFNPNATKFYYINLKLQYAEALKKEVLGQLITKEMDLHYVLELNDGGEILGGEWAGSQSRKYHPDFIWIPFEPTQPNGTRFMGNPHVNAQEVIKLWAESAGFDPNQQPPRIKRPIETNSWGRWDQFEVLLDGKQKGAVFMGRPTLLEVRPKGGLVGPGISLDIELNGAPLKSFAASDPSSMKFSFGPRPGLSILRFVWKKDGTTVDEQYLRYHVMP
jgi:hypothetical protein